MYELILGDCIKVMRSMPDKSVDCIVSDMPYGVNIGGAGQRSSAPPAIARTTSPNDAYANGFFASSGTYHAPRHLQRRTWRPGRYFHAGRPAN